MKHVQLRLAVMMLLQYFIWGAWGVHMGTYMNTSLGFSGLEIGHIYSTTAIASIVSPLFMGYLADRFIASEKLIGTLHLLGAGMLCWAALITQSTPLFWVMLGYSLLYMPTIALTTSITFENVADPEKHFPIIRACAAPGWISAGLLVGFVLTAKPGSLLYPIITTFFSANSVILKPNSFLYMTAAASAVLGLYAFTLPHTPPKRKKLLEGDAAIAKQGIFSLLKDPSFLVFTISSFLICIPLAFYYGFANAFLEEIDAPYPTALQTMGQVSEAMLMVAMPWFIIRLGIKKMMLLGMLAWVIRYLCFSTLSLGPVILGLLLHSVCYDFFFVASQIYVDKKVDVSQRATAQSFISVVTLGFGMLAGSYLGGLTVNLYPPVAQVSVERVHDGHSEKANEPLPPWDPTGKSGIAAKMNLAQGDAIKIDRLPKQLVLEGIQPGEELIIDKSSLLKALNQSDRNHDGQITRAEWRRARARQWPKIWLWPAFGAAFVAIFFWFGFKDAPSAT